MSRRLTAQQRRERDRIAALNAERDEWVRRLGTDGWRRELNRRRAARTERSRARRVGAVPLPSPGWLTGKRNASDFGKPPPDTKSPQLTFDDYLETA